MASELRARDLLPLLQHLSSAEQVQLAKLALRAAANGGSTDAETYRATPPGAVEFFSEETDALAWDAEGWDEFDATR